MRKLKYFFILRKSAALLVYRAVSSSHKTGERFGNEDEKSEGSDAWRRGALSPVVEGALFHTAAASCASGRCSTTLTGGPGFSLKKLPVRNCDTMTLQNASFFSPTSLLSCWNSVSFSCLQSCRQSWFYHFLILILIALQSLGPLELLGRGSWSFL